MENKVILKVLKNHSEVRKINNTKFIVYTLTDYSSGKNFDCWCRQEVKFLDDMKLLTEIKAILFDVYVNDNKSIKLRPVEVR